MTPDKELEAMAAISEQLAGLENLETKERVIRWVLAKHNLASGVISPPRTANRAAATTEQSDATPAENFGATEWKDFPEFFNSCNPETEVEKALVGGYWFQEIQKQENFEAYPVNRELKHLGHALSNIARALGVAMAEKPALVIQAKKRGNTQQGKKEYRLTLEGVKVVQAMFQ